MRECYSYLVARDCQRFRYNVLLQTFETCTPTNHTFINSICCKQWGQWQAIDVYLSYALVEALKIELLIKQGYL